MALVIQNWILPPSVVALHLGTAPVLADGVPSAWPVSPSGGAAWAPVCNRAPRRLGSHICQSSSVQSWNRLSGAARLLCIARKRIFPECLERARLSCFVDRIETC